MEIDSKLIDSLLAEHGKRPQDIAGENGWLKQLTKAILERPLVVSRILFGGGKVAMFLGGNTVSSLTNLGLTLTGNAPPPQNPGMIALGGLALGLPVNDALRLACRQTIPELTSASGFIRGQVLQTMFKAATGPASLTSIAQGGEIALQGGITASEYASGIALAKFVYDGATFLYGYFGSCQ